MQDRIIESKFNKVESQIKLLDHVIDNIPIKNCPHCGHIVLMVRRAVYPKRDGDYLCVPVDSPPYLYGGEYHYTCLTCGKTFRESTETKLVEVKNEDS